MAKPGQSPLFDGDTPWFALCELVDCFVADDSWVFYPHCISEHPAMVGVYSVVEGFGHCPEFTIL